MKINYMPLFVFRTHTIPTGNFFMDQVKKWYETELKRQEVLPSTFDINFKIRKKWKREDVWHEVSLPIEVPTAKVQMQAMSSDSMDQLWLDKKPEGTFHVNGTLNCSDKKCSICLERSGDKIRLENCNCLFHRHCIENWARYGNTCPKCFRSINMENKHKKSCNDSVNENENEIVV